MSLGVILIRKLTELNEFSRFFVVVGAGAALGD